MSPDRGVDVVIAGAGMAGAATAAALGELGFAVLVVEPGIDHTKRLAGELIHPPGATDLASLGLLGALEGAGAVAVRGFSVFFASEPYVLPYANVLGLADRGLALDHARLGSALHEALVARPHVTVERGARVVALDTSRRDAVAVTIARDGREVRVSARLVVGADGGSSAIRRLAGIGHQRRRLSTMFGYVLRGVALPRPGFGNVFIGGPILGLAYPIGPDSVRVMLDVRGDGMGADAPAQLARHVIEWPWPSADAVRDALVGQQPLASASYSIVPDRVADGRVVFIGDAAGCCHPLTATGLSACTRDALRLRDALRADPTDVPAALRAYAAGRAGPQRTRLALAEALYEVFQGRTPEMRMLQRGVLRYWRWSRRGRATSMALLSTHEGRMSVMVREYARVVACALPSLLAWDGRRDVRSLAARSQATVALSRATLRYAGVAWKAMLA